MFRSCPKPWIYGNLCWQEGSDRSLGLDGPGRNLAHRCAIARLWKSRSTIGNNIISIIKSEN